MLERVTSLPSHLRLPSRAAQIKAWLAGNLNFYRIHLLAFAFIPLIMSGIMYGISTAYHIDYIDCLFNCMSAMTVTGLATVNLSTLSAMQQVLLFAQMTFGSLTFVSILMILVRIYFFRQKFKHVILEAKRKQQKEMEGKPSALSRTISRVVPAGPIRRRLSMLGPRERPPAPEGEENGYDPSTPPSSVEMKPVPHPDPRPTTISRPHTPDEPSSGKQTPKKKRKIKINKDMIKRVEGGGVGMVNPMGWYDSSPIPTGPSTPTGTPSGTVSGQMPVGIIATEKPVNDSAIESDSDSDSEAEGGQGNNVQQAISDSRVITSSPPPMSDTSPDAPDAPGNKTPYAGRVLDEDAFPRAKTIAFEDDLAGPEYMHPNSAAQPSRGFTSAREAPSGFFPRVGTTTGRSFATGFGGMPRSGTTTSFPRTYSVRPASSRRPEAKYNHYGGFPMPLEIGKRLFKKAFPERHKTLTQSLTMPRSNTIGRRGTIVPETEAGVEKEVPYITFAAVVGRNSRFEGLTEEQMDELGGVEYRALNVLLYIVVGYFLFMQLAAFAILAPYITAQGRYAYVFDAQPQQVSITWFSLWQAVSAFSNTGMSLADQSMIPFQTAYVMVAVIVILIFAGNTAYPVFLRLTVWMIYKMVPKESRTKETLKFLLDHPRRCFVYMFPATQTWVLACVMITLYLIDFVCFLVLDIGTEEIQSIPVGTRISAAFLQSAAVRAAGFAIVPLAALAPAVKVLYVVMMYVSVYPIALSVRSTNVYEEKSLGLFEEEEMEDDVTYGEKGASAVAKYVGWHARRQLAFDIWWLGFALWLICIIERGNIINTNNATWFNVFNIIFELVSAYGTVGLSLGVPYDNFSFVGSWSVLGKLVLVLVMLRGRHRGLPVAIDRAVMLPKDFTAEEEQAFEETRSRRASRRESFFEAGPGGLYPVASRTYSNASPRRQSSVEVSPGLHTAPPGVLFAHGDQLTGSPGTYSHDSSGDGSFTGVGGLPTPVRKMSPLNPIHIRSQSASASASASPSGVGAGAGATGAGSGSPAQLSFALPRTSTMGSRSSVGTTSGSAHGHASGHGHGYGVHGHGYGGSGALSPVRESGLSREPTRVEKS